MAAFDFYINEDLERQLRKLQNPEPIIIKMINAGLEVYRPYLLRALENHKVTGTLLNSIRLSKAKQRKNNIYSGFVLPVGEDEKGVRNAYKLAIMEYGKHGQAPNSIVSKAMLDATPAISETMQKVFDEETK